MSVVVDLELVVGRDIRLLYLGGRVPRLAWSDATAEFLAGVLNMENQVVESPSSFVQAGIDQLPE